MNLEREVFLGKGNLENQEHFVSLHSKNLQLIALDCIAFSSCRTIFLHIFYSFSCRLWGWDESVSCITPHRFLLRYFPVSSISFSASESETYRSLGSVLLIILSLSSWKTPLPFVWWKRREAEEENQLVFTTIFTALSSHFSPVKRGVHTSPCVPSPSPCTGILNALTFYTKLLFLHKKNFFFPFQFPFMPKPWSKI